MDDEQDIERSFAARHGQRFPGLEQLAAAILAHPEWGNDLLSDPVAALTSHCPQIQLSPFERRVLQSLTEAHDLESFLTLLWIRLDRPHS